MVEKNKISSESLLALARALSAQYGVEVRMADPLVTASTAVTEVVLPSGKKVKKYIVSIPELSREGDGNYLPLTRLYIDHEVGHVRFTDFDAGRNIGQTLHTLLNIFEDNRVEYLMGEYFPGCKINLAEGNKILYPKMVASWKERSIFNNALSPGEVLNFVCIYLIGQMLVYSGLEDLRSVLVSVTTEYSQLISGVIDKLAAIAKEAVQNPGTTATSLEYAKGVLSIITIPDDSSSVRPSQQDSTEGTRPQDSSGTGLFSEADYDSSIPLPDKSAQLVDQLSSYQPRVREAIRYGFSPVKWVASPPKARKPIECLDYKAITEVLDSRLRALLQAYKMNYGVTARQGRLAYRKLYRLAVNDSRVFERRAERQQLNTEVVVLCDASGSMQAGRHQVVAPSVCALLSCLKKLTGVTSHAYAFAGEWVAQIVAPLDRVVSIRQFNYECKGGTPLGFAMQVVLHKFEFGEDSRKILLIMTDGLAADKEKCTEVYKIATKMGVEVLGLNIQHDALHQLLPDGRVADVNNLAALPKALFGLLQKQWLGVA